MTESPEVTVHSDRPARLTLRGFADSVQREVFDADRGLLGTWLHLWGRPGATIRRYVEWRDSRLTPPVRYAIVCLALSALLLQWFGISLGYKTGFMRGLTEAETGSGPVPAWASLVGEHLHWWLYLVAIPAMAAALESGYRSRINLAEALAFATYALAQISLGVALLLVSASELLGYEEMWLLLIWPLYFAVACHGYFESEGCGWVRALSTTVWMLALLMIFSVAVIFVVVAAGRLLG